LRPQSLALAWFESQNIFVRFIIVFIVVRIKVMNVPVVRLPVSINGFSFTAGSEMIFRVTFRARFPVSRTFRLGELVLPVAELAAFQRLWIAVFAVLSSSGRISRPSRL
jgi:hypothetical protein